MTRRLLLAFSAALLLLSARQRSVGVPEAPPLDQALRDRFSFSEPLNAIVRHISLDLTVDFTTITLHGTSTLDVENLTGTDTLVLDTQFLTIEEVTVDGAPATWTQGAETTFGAPLRIGIPSGTSRVAIQYRTALGTPSLFWAPPIVFSLSESNRARSWMPCQDTPSVRTTYDATLRVPAGRLALMSADNNRRTPNGSGVYHFEMHESVPSYLIAFAVGPFEYRALGARTGVYAQAAQLDNAAWQLQYLEAMLTTAEGIAGPHPFPRHDILIMPPIFPYGGMEHPMLNFITGAIVPAQVNQNVTPQPDVLIAHELAHSWAGDATTLATWEDVWINEGVTSYLALRIIEEMSGPARANAIFSRDRRELESRFPNFAPENTILHRSRVPHPDAGFTITSYLKGELFLRTLEDFAGRAAFDSFLRDYFDRFAFRWVDDRNFVALLREHFGDAMLTEAQVPVWLYFPGLPDNITVPRSEAETAAQLAPIGNTQIHRTGVLSTRSEQ